MASRAAACSACAPSRVRQSTTPDSLLDLIDSPHRVLVFPDSHHEEAKSFQQSSGLFVPPLSTSDLLSPPRGVRLRRPTMERAPMPEAAVDEDCHPLAGEDEVGTTADLGDRSLVDPISEAAGVQLPPDGLLAACVPLALRSHSSLDCLGRSGWHSASAVDRRPPARLVRVHPGKCHTPLVDSARARPPAGLGVRSPSPVRRWELEDG